jgi:aryl-alcohol dehydrogenase-like predicted oxidoreductase
MSLASALMQRILRLFSIITSTMAEISSIPLICTHNGMKRRGNRKEMIIATKVSKLDTRPGLKSANIIAACDDSLRRLQTDYIDLYYAHQDDPDTPIEETLSTFDSLIKSGKVRYIAASNFTAARLQESLDISKTNNIASYVACQDQYNLMDRDYEKTLRDTVEKNGLSEIPFYGLARGFLSGKYRPGVAVESVRATGVANSYANERGWAMLEKLDQIAKERYTSVSSIALAWLRQQKTVSAPIASATKLEQIKELMPIVELNTSELQELTNS